MKSLLSATLLIGALLTAFCGPAISTPTGTEPPAATLTSTSLPPTVTPTPTPAVISPDNVSALVQAKLFSGRVGGFSWAQDVTFSPDLSLYTTSYDSRTRILWESATGREIATLAVAADQIWSARFSPDGKTVLTADDSATIIFWDTATGEELRRVDGYAPTWAPDGQTIAVINAYRSITIFDAHSGAELSTIRCGGPCPNQDPLVFSPDGTRIAGIADDGAQVGNHKVIVWDMASETVLYTLSGDVYKPLEDEYPIGAVAFSPDGRTLVSVDSRGTFIFWDLETGEQTDVRNVFTARAGVRSLELGWFLGPESLAFSPDGKLLAAGFRGGSILFWDVAGLRPLHVILGHGQLGFDSLMIMKLAFSPDGKQLVSSDKNNLGTLWGLPDRPQPTPTPGQSFVVLDETGRTEGRTRNSHPWSAAAGTYFIDLQTSDNTPFCILSWQVRTETNLDGPTEFFGDSNIPATFNLPEAGKYIVQVYSGGECPAMQYSLKVSRP